ncbi:5'-nucleotidase, lipoprotein e(P4) family [Acinetobacter pragensis]|uniref:5'-nucleotidase n=1 Tax=Acinetobacter pragensis TaxID=1806892 RepID=A0A151XYI0_9GAMM|nr:5'-nucleotidase, lipoprotein e(P4) family [Acinetobacter pragensis]KYQ70816.1 5'-nucleotidase [Acinetobacter pragensis]
MYLTKKKWIAAFWAIAVCSSAPLQAKEAPSCPAVQQYGMSLKFQNRSAEVQALQLQAYNLATHRLKEILQANPQAKNLAIVTDLDETVLDNTDVFVSDLKRCEDYTDWKSWDEWERSGQPKLIQGSLEFLKFADQQGVKIFYVSDRSEKYRSSAMRMMKQLDLPQVESSQILLYGASKEQRRQSASQDCDIVLLLGDTLHDFSAAFSNKQSASERAEAVVQNKEKFGDRFIVLPNVSYGAWSTAE